MQLEAVVLSNATANEAEPLVHLVGDDSPRENSAANLAALLVRLHLFA